MSSPKIIEYMMAFHTDVNEHLKYGWNLYAQPI